MGENYFQTIKCDFSIIFYSTHPKLSGDNFSPLLKERGWGRVLFKLPYSKINYDKFPTHRANSHPNLPKGKEFSTHKPHLTVILEILECNGKIIGNLFN